MLQETPLGGLHEITRDRSALMHERGHTYYGTVCPDRCEAAAVWAARRLIAPRALLAAARHERRVDAIADTLNVTPGDVRAYLAALTVNEWLIMQRLVGHELV
jgi:hypothetical protein